MSQDSTTHFVFKDVYGNPYNSKGIVETQYIKPTFKGRLIYDTISVGSSHTYIGGIDKIDILHIVYQIRGPRVRNLDRIDDFCFQLGKSHVKIPAKVVNGSVAIFINGAWYNLEAYYNYTR